MQILREPFGHRHLLLAVHLEHENPRDVIHRLDEFKPALTAHDADRGVQAVGDEAVAGDDGNAARPHKPQASLGIDDVRIALAANVNMLVGITGRGDASVAEQQMIARWTLRIF